MFLLRIFLFLWWLMPEAPQYFRALHLLGFYLRDLRLEVDEGENDGPKVEPRGFGRFCNSVS